MIIILLAKIRRYNSMLIISLTNITINFQISHFEILFFESF